MRDIKFRAWNTKLQTMADSENFKGALGSMLMATNYQGAEQFIFMQFTGLHDKNGKEIYEGDILFVEIYGNLGDISEEECFNAKIVWLDNAFHLVDSEGDTWTEWLTTYQGKDVKIIGNIYENPELLKEEVK